ncbi:MAG: hypothetical protein ACYDD1_10915 [Caulobacteraceae bacterium]
MHGKLDPQSASAPAPRSLYRRARAFAREIRDAPKPEYGSNTYRLYRQGWRGLTIEPNPEAAESFRRLRPRDQHLVEGVSRSGGELTYYEFEESVLNTFSTDRVERLAQKRKEHWHYYSQGFQNT